MTPSTREHGPPYVPLGTIHAPAASLSPIAGTLWARVLRAARTLGVVAAQGARWTARSLAYHRPLGRLPDGRWIVELCAGWVAQIPGVTSWAAREGWREVVQASHLPTLTSEEVRAAGLTPRVAARHGKYLVLTRDQIRALRVAVDEWGAAGYLAPEHLDDDPGWTPTTPDKRGERPNRWQTVHCPYHADTSPSAGIRWNTDGVTGGFHCFVCQRPDGRSLTGIARRRTHGIEVLRTDETTPTPTRKTPTDSVGETWTSTFNTRGGTRAVGVGLQGAGGVGDGGSVQGVKLRSDGTRRWSSYTGAIRDPYLSALRADDRAGWASRGRAIEEAGAAYCRAAGRAAGRLPDPRGWRADDLYTVDHQRPTEWAVRQTRDGLRSWTEPIAWESTSRRHVLIDLDGIEGLTWDARRRVGRSIERVVRLHPDLTGAHFAVQTSERGVQVLAELRQAVAPGRFGTPAGARWYLALASALLEAVRSAGATGGQVDPASMDAGRLGRMPGVRLTKSGLPWAARLLALALPAGLPLTARDERLVEKLRVRLGR